MVHGVPPEPAALEDLRRTATFCRRRYLRYPHVLDVGVGIRQTAGLVRWDEPCIQFYVSRKHDAPPPGRLPRYVHLRRADGSPDRRRRLPTDVLPLGPIALTLASGDTLEAVGESGAVTLAFRNNALPSNRMCLLTCAHVVGDVRYAPPADERVAIHTVDGITLAGRTVLQAVSRNHELEYDIALIELDDAHSSLPAYHVDGCRQSLRGFLAAAALHPGLCLSTAFPRSPGTGARVRSTRLSLPVILDGACHQVNNLWLVDGMPQHGDSGGLLYTDGLAAGILVARCDEGGLFQPLGEATKHLECLAEFPIRCFTQEQHHDA